MRQTTMLKPTDVKKEWYVVDATDIVLGRLATVVASILRGKNKVNFTSHVDCGDNIIIINANKISLTGNKMQIKKYYNHSGYPGGLRVRSAKTMIDNYPIEMIERAIKGMLPHTTLGRQQGMNLFVYETANHPHEAQKPKKLVFQNGKGLIVNE